MSIAHGGRAAQGPLPNRYHHAIASPLAHSRASHASRRRVYARLAPIQRWPRAGTRTDPRDTLYSHFRPVQRL